jgi:hypothetical protein
MLHKSKWTPGPWSVDPTEQYGIGGERIFKVVQHPSNRAGDLIADVSSWWVDRQSAEANARLIAAAPLMVKVLRLCLVEYKRVSVDLDILVRAALRAAEGGEDAKG